MPTSARLSGIAFARNHLTFRLTFRLIFRLTFNGFHHGIQVEFVTKVHEFLAQHGDVRIRRDPDSDID